VLGPPPPLRLLFVINDLARAGAETQLVALAMALDPARYDRRIVVLKERNDFADALAAAGIPVVALRRRGWPDLGVALRLWGEMRRFRPDIVHSFLFLGNLLAAFVGRLAGVHRIVVSQRCSYDATLPPFWRYVARLSHRLADCVLVNSRAALAEERDAGFPPSRLVHVPNAARPWVFPGGHGALGHSSGAQVVAVGQLETVKGHRFLVDAWPTVRRAHPAACLVLVGEGSARGALGEQARCLGVADSVVFVGFRSPADAFIAACDVLVQPSLTEGLPNAVLEAMAAGRPVIASRVGGVPELVVDGETGLLVPPADPDALARAIVALLDDPDLGARLGAAGARRARTMFSLDAVRAAVEAVYGAAGAPSASGVAPSR